LTEPTPLGRFFALLNCPSETEPAALYAKSYTACAVELLLIPLMALAFAAWRSVRQGQNEDEDHRDHLRSRLNAG
jgi:hypothetical protein